MVVPGVMWIAAKKCWPHRFSHFDVNWRHTDKQTIKINIEIQYLVNAYNVPSTRKPSNVWIYENDDDNAFSWRINEYGGSSHRYHCSLRLVLFLIIKKTYLRFLNYKRQFLYPWKSNKSDRFPDLYFWGIKNKTIFINTNNFLKIKNNYFLRFICSHVFDGKSSGIICTNGILMFW